MIPEGSLFRCKSCDGQVREAHVGDMVRYDCLLCKKFRVIGNKVPQEGHRTIIDFDEKRI